MKGNDDLKANAEKALRMKRDAGPQGGAPDHRTSRKGGVAEGQVDATDPKVGKEGVGVPNLKRSHNARAGDA
ncbi:hypothetical protein NK718_20840 [Alsobacter sp. SYSU M60028]|uniref:Uncharacterized protein n=1 Tax=Alsobacter ponti TaxID=2962936 RepID=A0ABT1LHK7_9HYPH|nr:hypothetical protein [Alsobacter ponti]MCP8940979.1 hypothetical protein [Alsobacter ponti]